jgi:spore maturation protein SpmA
MANVIRKGLIGKMKMAVFWVVAPCSLVEIYQKSTRLHGATTQKTAIFLPTIVRTSNPTIGKIFNKSYMTETLPLIFNSRTYFNKDNILIVFFVKWIFIQLFNELPS